jgi:hypothetical protein
VSLNKTSGKQIEDKQVGTVGEGKLEVVQPSGAVYKV